jgi:integrase
MRIYKVKLKQRPGRKGWYGQYFINGDKHFEKFGDTLSQAELKRADVMLRLNSGEIPTSKNVTFDTMKEQYKNHLEAGDVKSKTIYNYMLSIERFKDLCGPLSSVQLSTAAIDLFKRKRKGQCKLVSVNTDLRAIRAFINWLRNSNIVVKEIKVPLFTTPETNPRALDDKVITKLINLAEELGYHDLRLMLQIAASTGLRRSDIQKLAEKDIDRKKRILTATLRKTGVIVEIPISEDLVKAIDNYLFLHVPKHWELIFHEKRLPAECDYFFPDKRWETLRKKAGLGERNKGWDADFKSFRSTAFTNMAEQGVPVEVVQKIAGHKSITTTMKYYMHVRTERLKQIAVIPNATKWFAEAQPTMEGE